MIRHRKPYWAFASLAFGASLLCAAGAQAQPYQPEPYEASPDPYALPPGYNQVTGYDDPDAAPGYPPEYEGPASYDEPAYDDAPPVEDYAEDRSGYAPRYDPSPRYVEDPAYAAAPRDDSHYNSGASVRGSSTYSRDGYVRSGESYSSRERSSSTEAYVAGEIEYDADGRVIRHDRAYAGPPVYIDERGYSREGEAYSEDRSGYSARYSSSSSYAPFAYQRRFNAFSVASETSEEVSVESREEYAYARRGDYVRAWADGDVRLDSSFMGSLTGGVEGTGPVMWSGGGGYASFSASASAFAGARAFAGVRGARGHRGKGRGHRCGC